MADPLLNVTSAVRNCVRRNLDKGMSMADATQACREPRQYTWPAFPENPPSVASLAAAASPCPSCKAKGKKGRSEGLRGLSKHGGDSLGSGRVVPPNVRAVAQTWAKDLLATGHVPPLDYEEWRVAASRLGLSDREIGDGWRYIEKLTVSESSELENPALEELRKVLGEFSGKPYGGYMVIPHELRVKIRNVDDASFPFRTKAAERVYACAIQIIGETEQPIEDIRGVFNQAVEAAEVSPFDLTPEDYSLLDLALYWLVTRKEIVPEPPKTPNVRGVAGMKGTRTVPGSPRGAP